MNEEKIQQRARLTLYLAEQLEVSGNPPLRQVSASILQAKCGANQASYISEIQQFSHTHSSNKDLHVATLQI